MTEVKNESEPRRSELLHQPLKAVRRPDSDAIGLAETLQSRGKGLELVRKLVPGPSDALLAEYDSKPLWQSRGRLCKQQCN